MCCGCTPLPERRCALAGLFIGLIIALIFAVALGGLGNMILSYALCIAVTIASIYSCIRLAIDDYKKKKDVPPEVAAPISTSAEAAPVDGGESGAPPPQPTRMRVDYLDRLKTALTALVIAHHVTCAFVGDSFYLVMGAYPSAFKAFFGAPFLMLNQSYFMSLFFISGFFSPTSLDRKGAKAFLLDKFKRLGTACSAFVFVGNPLTALVCVAAVGGRTFSYSSSLGPGPTWYLAWLLLFSCSYAVIGGPPMAPMPRPHLLKLVGIGAALGLLQAGIIATGMGTFATMPISVGSLPFDIAFFAGGIAARRGGWLDTPLSSAERAFVWAVSVFVFLGIVGGSIANELTYLASGPSVSPYPSANFPFPACNATGTATGAEVESCTLVSMAVLFLAFGLAAGCFTVAWSAALLDFFLRYCNAPRGPITTELGRSAYAVYVIHPLIVVPLVAAYLAILRGPWETEVDFPPGTSKSSTPMAEGKLVLGFATVMPLSLVLTWTVAAGFRRLPGLRDVF